MRALEESVMRFTENGPVIPDELLLARDEGRVVLICGSGVSRARAGLPDFAGLADQVIRQLGVPADSDALRVLAKAQQLGEELAVPGFISMDRVFGLLEREFTTDDIHAAVAKALAPTVSPDLSAHKILLRLARTPQSTTQLVTTNFDRLFDVCGNTLESFQPPLLPSLSRPNSLNGIVYLHGRVNDDYTAAEGSGFFLSSSDFGHAYLADGWATAFVRELIRDYVVVFIGYSADDPPVSYLLEGLRKSPDPSRRLYALHSASSDEAIAAWVHKGVESIPYSPANRHDALWETLERWAERADDPDLWRRNIIERATSGPQVLKPHERGQIAHIVSTYQGAREFAEQKPPAEWLCVFDPACRYALPDRQKLFDQQTPAVNPFSLFALDSDSVIAQSDPDFRGRERDIPTDAWDAFAANQYDQQDLLNGSFATFRGYYAANVPQLPKRLRCLASWIADVANQPAAVWWAVRQEFLHPDILKRMEQELERRHDEFGPALASAWHYLLEARSHSRDDSKRDWFGLKRDIDRGGWNAAVLRRFSAITRPYLKVGPALTYRAAPPAKDEECHLRDLVRLEVECPVPPHDADIPDAWLASVISEQRKNIELALQISEEVDDMHRFHISPIEPDSRPDISDYGRTHGISGCVAMFASLFDRLIALNVRMAKKEYASWPTGDDTVFARLRIWASGKQQLTTPHAFAQVVLQVSDDVFWSSDHQRDLLIVLARRWGEFSTQDKKRVENRLLVGPKQWEGQDDAVYKKYRAWSVLNRLQWLADNQCEFTFDFAKEMEKHRAVAPDWRPEYADRAAESREPRGGFVTTITDHDALLHGPIGEVLSTAQALSGRSHDNRLEESDPFAGLCLERPKRAYLSLAHAARKAEYPEWAWNTFLYSPALKKDEPRCSAVIAARICRLPDSALQVLFYPTTMWLKGVSKSLPKECPETFWKLVSRLIDVLSKVPACGRSAISGERRNWVDRAINSPPGHLAQAILQSSDHEPIDTSIKSSAAWLGNIERLLSLTGDPRRFAIAVVAHHLDWLHRRVPDWTERHLLAILEGDDHQDREALLAGFLWNPRVSSSDLYLRLKPSIFALVKERGEVQESHLPTLASFLLKGWIESAENKDARLMSNDEFRELLLHGGNSFRSHVIWHFQDGLDTPEDSERRTWSTRANLFLREVWPRQKAVKNAEMTISLCELLLASNESFPMLVDCVLPLLAKLTRNNTFRWHWRNESIDLINTHPRLVLRMLDIILPDDVSEWPFGIAEALDKIGEADHTLTSDPLWQHLMRKWKSR